MKAKDIMSQSVLSVEPTDTVFRALSLMLFNHVSELPVIDAGGKLAGVVRESDLIPCAEADWLEFLAGRSTPAGERALTSGRNISEVMTQKIDFVTEETSLDEIEALMEKSQVEHVPVLRAGKVVGIVTPTDLMRLCIA